MKSVTNLILLIFLLENDFLISQSKTVDYRFYLDANGDCIRQSNEDFNVNTMIGYYIYSNSAPNAQSNIDARGIMDTFTTIELPINTYYYIEVRYHSLTQWKNNVNCSTFNSYYRYFLGNSDTVIYIPLSDTMTLPSWTPGNGYINQSIITNQIDTYNFCKNDFIEYGSTSIHKTSGKAILELNWGDGVIDSIDLNKLNFDEYKGGHRYQTNGNFKFSAKLIGINLEFLLDTLNFKIENCYSIEGNIFLDTDSNCSYTKNTDILIPNYSITVSDSNRNYIKSGFTNDTGYYSILVPINKGYTLRVTDGVNCNLGSKLKSVVTSSLPSSVNFALNKNDLDFSLSPRITGYIFPGDSIKIFLDYLGVINFPSAKYIIDLPYKSSFIRANLASSIINTGNQVEVVYNSKDLYDNYLVYKFDTTLAFGDTVCFYIKLTRILNEKDTLNNEVKFCRPAMVAFDPNDKQVGIKSIDKNGNFTDKSDYLNYLIRFQNTGNAPARNIYILDSLDLRLDKSTIKVLSSSHKMNTLMNDNNIIKFDFQNINLIDSFTDEKNSHGFVSFQIKPISELKLNETILNSASIYFDFNPPVLTNTVLNKYVLKSVSVGNQILNTKSLNLELFPIPSSKFIYFNHESIMRYEILDISGREINKGTCKDKIDISNLVSGVYFINIHLGDRSAFLKFIKE